MATFGNTRARPRYVLAALSLKAHSVCGPAGDDSRVPVWGGHVERELALIKVTADPGTRAEIMNIVGIFRAKVVDVGPKELIIEITGDDEKIEAIMRLLGPLGIKEVARTGKAALFRGDRLLTVGAPKSTTTKGKGKAA